MTKHHVLRQHCAADGKPVPDVIHQLWYGNPQLAFRHVISLYRFEGFNLIISSTEFIIPLFSGLRAAKLLPKHTLYSRDAT